MVSSVPRDAGGGAVVEVGAVGQRAGHGGGLLLAADDEPDRLARLRAPRVRLMRSGGGLGEPVTATAIWSSTSSWGKPGNSEATWPSGPTPSMRTSNAPLPCGAQGVGVRRGARLDVGRRRRWTASGAPWRGPHPRRRGSRPGLARRCGRGSRGPRTARRPTRPRPATSPPRTPAESRASSRWTASAMVPPVSAICGSWPLLWASASRASSSPAIAVASASADSCTSIRGGVPGAVTATCSWSASAPPRRRRRPRRGGAAPRRAARAPRGGAARSAGRGARGRSTSPAGRRAGRYGSGPRAVSMLDRGDPGPLGRLAVDRRP